MKKLLLIGLTVLFMGTVVPLLSTHAADMSGVAFGTVSTFDDFKHTDFGGRLGFQIPFDSDRGMTLRMVYSHIDLGESKMTTIAPTMLWEWYLGKKWDIWWTLGGEAYLDGPNEGFDYVTGFGVSRKIATINKDWPSPASLEGFGEITFTDASGEATGSYAKLNLGVVFSPGSSK